MASASTPTDCRRWAARYRSSRALSGRSEWSAAASNYSVSDEGTLVYIAKGASSKSLMWVNRDGTPGGTLANIPPGTYEEPRLSPDDRRVLVTRSGDIWVYDIASGRSDRRLRRRHQSDGRLGSGWVRKSRTRRRARATWRRGSNHRTVAARRDS